LFSKNSKEITHHKYEPKGLLGDDNLKFPLKERVNTINELKSDLKQHFFSNSSNKKEHPIP
jgi:hypothetical protein